MMKNIIHYCMLFIVVFAACNKDVHKPLVDSGQAPAAPERLQAESLPGAIKVTYTPPAEESFLYVEATYTNVRGEKMMTKSSAFKNFILLEGFADTALHQIDLVSVSKSEKRSPAVSINARATKAPITTVYESISINENFGGIDVEFTNELKNEYVLNTLMYKPDSGWRRIDRLYTSAPYRNYGVRGLDSLTTKFGIYLTDKWGNISDTLITVKKPLYEEMIKKDWQLYPLPTDTYTGAYGLLISNLWDGKLPAPYYYIGDYTPTLSLPNHFTIDLKKTVKFSRILVNQFVGTGEYAFALGNPRNFEIWGTNSVPNSSGSYDGWTLLGTYESVKPSGGPLGVNTAEDIQYANNGEEYKFSVNTVIPVRYVRFRTIKTWAGVPNLLLSEITFYGQLIYN